MSYRYRYSVFSTYIVLSNMVDFYPIIYANTYISGLFTS